MLEGAHDVVTPTGTDTMVRATVPVNPPPAVKLTVDVADRPATNETVAGFAESGKSGPPALKNSSGDAALTSPCPRLPPLQSPCGSFSSEWSLYRAVAW